MCEVFLQNLPLYVKSSDFVSLIAVHEQDLCVCVHAKELIPPDRLPYRGGKSIRVVRILRELGLGGTEIDSELGLPGIEA